MATTVRLVKAVQQAGRFYLQWADGSGMDFNTFQEIKDWVSAIDDDPEFTKRLELALWLKKNPTGNNPGMVLNHDFTFDLNATPVINLV